MAVLTRKEIFGLIKAGSLSFRPALDKFQLQAHSVDLRIGFTFVLAKTWALTPSGRVALKVDYGENRKYLERIKLKAGQYFEILPGEFIGIETLEEIKIPAGLMAVLYPRSSINRRGLSVDLSGIIDAGYEGKLLVPVRNNTASQIIQIFPGERFCQVVFEDLASPVLKDNGRYQNKEIGIGVLKEKSRIEEKLVRTGKIFELKKHFQL
ncbi:MAG: dCTP deaminase [Patescibacteria group bacterium]